MTHKLLADLVDTDENMINKIENGYSKGSIQTLTELATVLDVSIAELIGEQSPNSRRKTISRQDISDFEIGYKYVRKRYSFFPKHSSQELWELGTAYLLSRGANSELSIGMGFFFLELGIKMRLAEITPDH